MNAILRSRRRTPFRLALPALALAVGLGFAPRTSEASDHSDGVKTAVDLAADLTDLFTFTSPENPNKLVLIMNVNGFAGRDSRFSDVVDYKFRIRPIADAKTLAPSTDPAKEQSIVCSFTGGLPLLDAKQRATCNFQLSGARQTISFDTRKPGAKAGGSGEENGLRVFAGVRSDPWYADLNKIVAFDKGTRPERANPKNGLQGRNVLSIVVEVDKSRLPGPLLAVTAQTVRKAGL
jgi:hypothetical protein